MDRVADLRFLVGGTSKKSTITRLSSFATILFTAVVLFVIAPLTRNPGVPLTEL